jgi:TonB family protein
MKVRLFLVAAVLFCSCATILNAQQPSFRIRQARVQQSVADGFVESKVTPICSSAVRNRNTTGQIVVMFTVDKNGNVTQAMAVPTDLDGRESKNADDPQLRESAVAAVRAWHYKPYLVAGEPVEMSTSVVLPYDFTQPTGHEDEDNAAQRALLAKSKEDQRPPEVKFATTLVDPKVVEEHLATRVEPTMPKMAQIAHIQGSVTMRIRIDKQGNVTNIKVVMGHPILAQAAIDAVHQWKYTPFMLNGESVEVESPVVIDFRQ